jgi:hypothetical protein
MPPPDLAIRDLPSESERNLFLGYVPKHRVTHAAPWSVFGVFDGAAEIRAQGEIARIESGPGGTLRTDRLHGSNTRQRRRVDSSRITSRSKRNSRESGAKATFKHCGRSPDVSLLFMASEEWQSTLVCRRVNQFKYSLSWAVYPRFK